LFDDAAGGKRAAARPAAAAAPHPTPDEPQALRAPEPKPVDFAFDVEPVAQPLPQTSPRIGEGAGGEVIPGIVLSPRTATLLIVAAILGLSLAFIVGMIVGSLLRGGPASVPKNDEVVSPACMI
jgi:hypothetical protein